MTRKKRMAAPGELQHLGEDCGRALFMLDLETFQPPTATLELPTANFVCLLAADFAAVTDEVVMRLASFLLDAGASYFVCWGRDCERAHGLIDQRVVALDPPPPDGAVVMTTWHCDEPLEEALFFTLSAAWPDPFFEDSTGCIVGVSIGSPEAARQILDAFADPRAFIARVAG